MLHQTSTHCLQWIEARLDKETAELAHGHDAVCLFVNDTCDAEVRLRHGAMGARAVCLFVNDTCDAEVWRLGARLASSAVYCLIAIDSRRRRVLDAA